MVEKTTARARTVGIIDQMMAPMMSSVRNLEAGGENTLSSYHNRVSYLVLYLKREN
jgi:hypothetical protein